MDKRQRQREDSAKIVGWAMIGFITFLIGYAIYSVICSVL
jgi:hypothetical protein